MNFKTCKPQKPLFQQSSYEILNPTSTKHTHCEKLVTKLMAPKMHKMYRYCYKQHYHTQLTAHTISKTKYNTHKQYYTCPTLRKHCPRIIPSQALSCTSVLTQKKSAPQNRASCLSSLHDISA